VREVRAVKVLEEERLAVESEYRDMVLAIHPDGYMSVEGQDDV
jgi:hypothetical protein